MRAIDWLGRVLLLVLSGTATLSLIGAIVETANVAPQPTTAPAIDAPATVNDGTVIRAPVALEESREPAVSLPDREAVQWLKALTYAVTALAGFAAAAVIVLLRITATLDRIARR